MKSKRFLVLILVLTALVVHSQEAGESITEQWYNMPIVWIIASALALLLLVVKTRNNNKKKD
ncbi:hypothetical protein SAMN05444008_11970 [Cnuella takakiae]|uniref:PEP-CTERM protein-sorting domain-containing protein n=1 Tax=Cnuella takakiae TaxID=1302690 RepID=A0A1M5HIL6_9BACT|nr:hypothetical protein [Cnuella takakiae]SHG15741.1 hypothetical protein SAMN05444008_11970 [Cnuella takakiae]